jgi:two-component system KDP operon response regulator KdpE
MDLVRHEVFLGDERLALTPKEYELLRYFMVNCGKMLLHKEILKSVWGAAHGEDIAYLRVYIVQIREKIEPETGASVFIKGGFNDQVQQK